MQAQVPMASSPRAASPASPTSPSSPTLLQDAESIVGRARRASLSVFNANPQLGIWQAAGTAIAQAPNLTELRDMDLGANNIVFNSQGHSARRAAVYEDTGRLALVRSNTRPVRRDTLKDIPETVTAPVTIAESNTVDGSVAATDEGQNTEAKEKKRHQHKHHLWHHSHGEEHGKKADIGPTILHGLAAFWKFFVTPAGFLITIYCLNIVVRTAPTFNNHEPLLTFYRRGV